MKQIVGLISTFAICEDRFRHIVGTPFSFFQAGEGLLELPVNVFNSKKSI